MAATACFFVIAGTSPAMAMGGTHRRNRSYAIAPGEKGRALGAMPPSTALVNGVCFVDDAPMTAFAARLGRPDCQQYCLKKRYRRYKKQTAATYGRYNISV